VKDQTLIANQIRELEEKLLIPENRGASEDIDSILSDDFLEIGSSGHKYNKSQTKEVLQEESGVQISLTDFQVQVLKPGLVLATYRAIKSFQSSNETIHSYRSSIWEFQEGRWQIIFHQGTLTEPQE
jgi:hypothetical protein